MNTVNLSKVTDGTDLDTLKRATYSVANIIKLYDSNGKQSAINTFVSFLRAGNSHFGDLEIYGLHWLHDKLENVTPDQFKILYDALSSNYKIRELYYKNEGMRFCSFEVLEEYFSNSYTSKMRSSLRQFNRSKSKLHTMLDSLKQ